MITLNSKLGTKEEISSLATKLRSVPDDKDDTVCPDVVKKLKQTEFYSVVVDLYKSNEELQFRRDATYLLRRVGNYGDKEDLKELVHRGIVRLILTDCVYSTDADLITNVVIVLRDVCSKHNRVLLSDIAEEGLYDKVIYLLETWKSNDVIAGEILFMINTICSYEMSLGEDIVSLNQPRLVDILINKHQLLIEITSSDTSCKVPAAILLNKYLDSIEESELLQLLLPPKNEMFTESGIVKLASNIKAIPDEEEEFEKQVIREVVSADFISKFIEQYDSNTEEVYRRNLTYVISRVAYLGDKAVISSLVKSGVIKHLITTCEHCTDSEVMCNISETLCYVAYDNGDFSHVDHLVEEGVLTVISKLLQKWSNDDTVMVRLLGTLQNIACYREDISELKANSTEYGYIPLLLRGLLETASSDSVIVETIFVISNLVVGTDVLHTVFLHASFFTTAFRHLQSTTLNSDSKQYLLCGIICTLANKNTDKMKDLLIPYSQPLKELAKTGSDSVLSVNAAILLNKYLDSIEESELLQLLIPPTNEMFTEGGIVKLASNIEAIPDEEEEFGKQVIREVVSADFISKFIEQYDSNTEEVYRRNLTYVLRIVAYLGDKAVRSSLVKSGVIKHLITTCEHCTDSEFMCNISVTLCNVAYDNGDFSHVDHLVKEGVLTLISKLLQKWSKDDTVMVRLLVTLQNIACYGEYIIVLIANSTEYGNIPLLLQELLETASSDSVIVETIDVIRNLVIWTDVLHTVFLHASFFTTAFRHLQSTTLNSDSKQYLLCDIICTLANKNTDKIKDLLIPYSQPLKEFAKTGSDSVLRVNAAILLNRYLDSFEESELLQLLIPPTNEMFTEGGIVKLASIIKAIPGEEEEFRKQVIRDVVSAEFISKFIEQYDSNTEEVYRRNLTYVMATVAYLGDTAVISSLVKSGVMKHLITTWEHCTDSEVMCNISGTLQDIAQYAYNNGDFSHVDHLVEEGVLTLISKLLQKWSEDDTVMVELLGTLQNITINGVDIKELIANSTEYGNIPELVTNIFQTSSNVKVLESTIGCIYNMLRGSMALHEHFSNTQLIDTCISRIRSDVLSSEYKIHILRSIVTRLTCNHPAKVTELLVPHTHSLKEIAELDTDTELSRLAAELINTYLSCGEKRHNCVLVNTLFILNILKFFALYIVDIVLDIKVGINAVNDATLSTRYEGYCLLLFSILPLIYLNHQSVLRYYIQCWDIGTVDPVISLQGSNRGRIMKFFFPWRFDSVKHTILNILTVLQLHPLITAFELVFHRSKLLSTIITNKFHFGRLSTQEKILENVPCTLIKGIILYKFIDNNKSDVDFSLGSDKYVTLFSTVYGILTLCYKVASFEDLCRSADKSYPGALTTCQKLVSFIGVLLSLNSRLIMCLVLFSVMRDNGTMWIFTISVLLHILLSSVTHLLSHHEWQSPYDSSVKRKFVIKDFILKEGDNRNSKLVIIGRCALVFCLSWSESFIVSLRHPIDLVAGRFPSTYHLRSSRQFFLIYVFHLLEVITVTVLANTLNSKRWIMDSGYVSLALFLVSGAMYMLYFTVLNPDRTYILLSVSINSRLKLFGYSQTNMHAPFCHVTEKATKINSTKVYSSNQYNYRLQVLDPCYDCMLGREHSDKYKPISKCYSPSSFLKKLRNCFTRPFNSTYRRLSPSISDAENLAENLQLRRKDVDLLITKVRKYDNIHLHLVGSFPGIETIADYNIFLRCRAIGSNVFRSIEDIKDDELIPNLVPACNKLKGRIENKYTDATEGDILNDELVEQISNLCEEYFSLKEQQWENKVLAWCETAPTEILAKYHYEKWSLDDQFIKDIEKWITEKERLAVYLNPCNNNASNLPDTTIVLYDEKHSNFHINGVKTPSKHGWVLRNCYHRNRGNSSSGQTEYQPVGQDIVTIETGQDIVTIETGQDIVNSAV